MKSLETDAYAFCEKAKKYELLLVPGDDFGAPGFVRIAYCVTTAQIEQALPAFEKLAKEYLSLIHIFPENSGHPLVFCFLSMVYYIVSEFFREFSPDTNDELLPHLKGDTLYETFRKSSRLGTGQLSFAAFCDSERHRDARQRPL